MIRTWKIEEGNRADIGIEKRERKEAGENRGDSLRSVKRNGLMRRCPWLSLLMLHSSDKWWIYCRVTSGTLGLFEYNFLSIFKRKLSDFYIPQNVSFKKNQIIFTPFQEMTARKVVTCFWIPEYLLLLLTSPVQYMHNAHYEVLLGETNVFLK